MWSFHHDFIDFENRLKEIELQLTSIENDYTNFDQIENKGVDKNQFEQLHKELMVLF